VTPFRDDCLAGKSILVTGGGTGLGRAIAESLMRHGATVHVCGRREGVLRDAVAEMSAATGGRAIAHGCNIRDPGAIDAMLDAIWSDGPLTGLVNNAAANFIAPTESLSPRGYDAVRSTVMDGNFYVTLATGKRWIDAGLPGNIVSNLVTWIWTGSAYVVPSAMAKTALHAMTMSLAVEWAKYGIRLNATAPGPFPTQGAWERLSPIPGLEGGATSDREVPMRRYGRTSELENLVIFLLGDGCDYLTGQTIAIDGGHHLASPSTFANLADVSPEQWAEAGEAIRIASDRDKAERDR
jgi:NAD(P)-dependent dehydrogenase (short-subunit alcohol dehydrogenase family)